MINKTNGNMRLFLNGLTFIIFDSFQECIPTKDALKTEILFLENQLTEQNSPIVFCHNDLLLKNIVYFEKPSRGVAFIDFEYADFNYQAFDIANHFCEFAGVDNFDPDLYPSKDFQLKWLEHYLNRRKSLFEGEGAETKNEPDSAFIADVQKLYFQVKKFTLAAHLFWGIWSLIQAEHSTIKFDFLGYAIDRLNEYFSKKSKSLNGHC